jgi:bifunctional UDP-N-acetylglucosamine pyrophosphorylase/glucosamine-1-phosphate N-acetyltransferase
MKSALPKALHEAAGRTLLEHVVRVARALDPEHLAVIIGHGAERVRARFPNPDFDFVLQREQLGTGHALMQTRALLEDKAEAVMVLNMDGPLVRAETLGALLEHHRASGAGMTMLTAEVGDPEGLGRIVREGDGSVRAIVEEKDASEEERRIGEINPGFFVFDREVFRLGERLSNSNASGEYYITDLAHLYLGEGKSVQAVLMKEPSEALAVNDRAQLAVIDRLLRDRVRGRWLREGVTMVAPEQTFIDDTVRLEPDVVLHPGVVLRGETVVRRGAVLGPYAVLSDCTVREDAWVAPFTQAEGQTF